MDSQVTPIALASLLYVVGPALLVALLLVRWSLDWRKAVYALGRMLGQLLLVGYFLAWIFDNSTAWIVLAILTVMVVASAWIALSSVEGNRPALFPASLVATAVGGGIMLLLVTQGVLDTRPWYSPRHVIPLAGMIFANAMNAVSLAAERLLSEIDRGAVWPEARNMAMNAALIPVTNTLFAVGLVSLPGMMTGQILAGVDPFIAARYQIMVMSMIFASAGFSAALFLMMSRKRFVRADD
ncbi:MAG TPA: ABC transporter permease [Chromatiales bacterium]|nr:ABC transporter permease [Chromatiales bacterium]